MNAGLEDGFFARLLDRLFDVALRLFHHFFNTRGVDPPVCDQFFEREPCNLAPDGIEPGDRDDLGGVVDDEFHAGQGFDGADVPTFAADDPPLHVLVGKRDDRDGDLADVIGGAALNREREDILRLRVGFFAELRLVLGEFQSGFVLQFSREFVKQFTLGFVARHTGDLLQFDGLGFLQRGDLRDLVFRFLVFLLKGDFLFLHPFEFAVQILLFLGEPVFLTRDLASAVLDLGVRVVLQAKDLFLRFEQRLLLPRFGGAERRFQDLFRFGFCGGEFCFAALF